MERLEFEFLIHFNAICIWFIDKFFYTENLKNKVITDFFSGGLPGA